MTVWVSRLQSPPSMDRYFFVKQAYRFLQ